MSNDLTLVVVRSGAEAVATARFWFGVSLTLHALAVLYLGVVGVANWFVFGLVLLVPHLAWADTIGTNQRNKFSVWAVSSAYHRVELNCDVCNLALAVVLDTRKEITVDEINAAWRVLASPEPIPGGGPRCPDCTRRLHDAIRKTERCRQVAKAMALEEVP